MALKLQNLCFLLRTANARQRNQDAQKFVYFFGGKGAVTPHNGIPLITGKTEEKEIESPKKNLARPRARPKNCVIV